MTWGVFVKKWKMGVFFVKKSGPFLDAECIMYSISIFYFTFYLFGGGCVRSQCTPFLRACTPRRWQRLAADLRPSEVGSAVRISLVAGQLQAASVPIAPAGTDRRTDGSRCRLMPSLQLEA